MTTASPAWLRRRTACAALGSNFTFAGSERNPGSSISVPSRSRKAAVRLRPGSGIECGTQRVGGQGDLAWGERARVEDDMVIRDARDHRRGSAAEPIRQGVGGEMADR